MTAIVIYFLIGAMFTWDGLRNALKGSKGGYVWLLVGLVIVVLSLRMYIMGIG
jgi:hypothetical protein